MTLSTFRADVERIIAEYESKDKAGSKINHIYGLVIYTDGGGDNATKGPCGGGAHGYLFDYTIGKVISHLPPNQTATDCGYYDSAVVARKGDGEDAAETDHQVSILKADGSDKFKQVGLKLKRVQPVAFLDMTDYLPRPSTSNRAEISGLLMALRSTCAISDLIVSAHYRLDSKYTINGFATQVEGWKARGWRAATTELKNLDLWKIVAELRAELMDAVDGGLRVSIEHVAGHADSFGNNLADTLTHKARVADTLTEPALRFELASTYHKASYIPNKFLHMPRWYYCTNDNQVIDGKTMYYIGRHGKEELDVAWGTRMAEQCYAVVLTDADPVLEKLRQHFELVSSKYKEDQIYYVHVDNVFKSSIYDDLMADGLLYTKQSRKKQVATDKSTLFTHADPVNTAYVGFDNFKRIEAKLMDFIHDRLPGNHAVTEITDQIYGVKLVKDKEVRITLPDVDASLVVSAKHRMKTEDEYKTHDVILTRGLDIPRRSLFLGIVDDDPKVYLLTWHESRNKFRYATIVKTNKGDIGIWLDLYSNQRIRGA